MKRTFIWDLERHVFWEEANPLNRISEQYVRYEGCTSYILWDTKRNTPWISDLKDPVPSYVKKGEIILTTNNSGQEILLDLIISISKTLISVCELMNGNDKKELADDKNHLKGNKES